MKKRGQRLQRTCNNICSRTQTCFRVHGLVDARTSTTIQSTLLFGEGRVVILDAFGVLDHYPQRLAILYASLWAAGSQGIGVLCSEAFQACSAMHAASRMRARSSYNRQQAASCKVAAPPKTCRVQFGRSPRTAFADREGTMAVALARLSWRNYECLNAYSERLPGIRCFVLLA